MTLAVSFTGCKKDEEEESVTLTDNQLYLNGKVTNGVALTQAPLKSVIFSNTGGETVLFTFKELPTTAGTFTIVDREKVLLGTMGDSEVALTVTTSGKDYSIPASSGKTLSLTVSDAKYGIVLNKTTLKDDKDNTVEVAAKVQQ